MLSRRLLILGWVCTLVEYPRPGHSQEAWTTYQNSRFGTSIAYQEFFEPDNPPENGDGQSFTGPEGANFRVYAHYNIDNETPASYLAQLLADPSRPNVTYKRIDNNRVTISGIRGALIYYDAYIFSRRGVVHAFEIEYPAKFKNDYDPTIQRMARSFTGP
jgi:hypothetical protein